MLKFSDNPPMRPHGTGSLADLPGQWWVAHTKARNEKALAWDLLRRRIGYFLPLRERLTFSGGRKRRGLRPLFPSYVFLCGDEDDRYVAMTTGRICRTIEVFDQATLIDELVAIERALAAKADLERYPGPAIGRRCRVIAGPFENLEGIVVQLAAKARFVLQVHTLGEGAALQIEAGLLEALDRGP